MERPTAVVLVAFGLVIAAVAVGIVAVFSWLAASDPGHFLSTRGSALVAIGIGLTTFLALLIRQGRNNLALLIVWLPLASALVLHLLGAPVFLFLVKHLS